MDPLGTLLALMIIPLELAHISRSARGSCAQVRADSPLDAADATAREPERVGSNHLDATM